MKNSRLKIKNILKNENKIDFICSYGSDWGKWLSKNTMFAKYSQNIELVPDGIAVIPIMCNLLPIMWIFDLEIEVEKLDKNFFESIPNIKKGYKKMYPNMSFKGNIIVNELIDYSFKNTNSAVLFSGGVDAFSTLISHIEEKPDLITIFGADINLDDKIGIDSVNKLNYYTSNLLKLKYKEIYSDFRETINYKELCNYVYDLCRCEWWHDFQHGIALLGLTAPIAYLNNYSKVYIASSFTPEDIGNYTCASDPTIDNYYCHSNSIAIHDGFENNRQSKIKSICDFVNKKNLNIQLRVCWISDGGNNCCSCEKCYRTILGIIAAGGNPSDYGFSKYESKKKKMIRYLKKNLKYNTKNGFGVNYMPIQRSMKNNEIIDKEYEWFVNYKIASVEPSKIYYLKLKIKNFIQRNIKKIRKIF